MSIEALIARLGEPIDPHTREIIKKFYPNRTSLIFDPSAQDNGFVLRLSAPTEHGGLDAAFSPSGDLSRGLVGDQVIHDKEQVISLWINAREANHGQVA